MRSNAKKRAAICGLFFVKDIYEEMLSRRLTPLYAIRTMRLLFYTAAMRF